MKTNNNNIAGFKIIKLKLCNHNVLDEMIIRKFEGTEFNKHTKFKNAKFKGSVLSLNEDETELLYKGKSFFKKTSCGLELTLDGWELFYTQNKERIFHYVWYLTNAKVQLKTDSNPNDGRSFIIKYRAGYGKEFKVLGKTETITICDIDQKDLSKAIILV